MTRTERYEDRKRRRVCVDCGERPTIRGRVRCPACRRKAVAASQRWAQQNRDHEREVRLQRTASLRLSNPEATRADQRARRAVKRANGMCLDCPRPSLEGAVRCKRCRDANRVWARESSERRRKRERLEIETYRPLDEIIDLTRVRVLRAAKPLEWFTCAQMFDALGGGNDTQRNTVAQMLTRLGKQGRLDRQRIPKMFSTGYGTQWEYQITQAGRDELAAILSGERRITFSGRRAA